MGQDYVRSTVNVLFLSSLRAFQEIQEKGDLLGNQYVIYLFWMNTDSQSGLQREQNSDSSRDLFKKGLFIRLWAESTPLRCWIAQDKPQWAAHTTTMRIFRAT